MIHQLSTIASGALLLGLVLIVLGLAGTRPGRRTDAADSLSDSGEHAPEGARHRHTASPPSYL